SVRFTPTAPPGLSPLSLHDALPISRRRRDDPTARRARAADGLVDVDMRSDRQAERAAHRPAQRFPAEWVGGRSGHEDAGGARGLDRKSTRLNSSHVSISYAVFCLKK